MKKNGLDVLLFAIAAIFIIIIAFAVLKFASFSESMSLEKEIWDNVASLSQNPPDVNASVIFGSNISGYTMFDNIQYNESFYNKLGFLGDTVLFDTQEIHDQEGTEDIMISNSTKVFNRTSHVYSIETISINYENGTEISTHITNGTCRFNSTGNEVACSFIESINGNTANYTNGFSANETTTYWSDMKFIYLANAMSLGTEYLAYNSTGTNIMSLDTIPYLFLTDLTVKKNEIDDAVCYTRLSKSTILSDILIPELSASQLANSASIGCYSKNDHVLLAFYSIARSPGWERHEKGATYQEGYVYDENYPSLYYEMKKSLEPGG